MSPRLSVSSIAVRISYRTRNLYPTNAKITYMVLPLGSSKSHQSAWFCIGGHTIMKLLKLTSALIIIALAEHAFRKYFCHVEV